MCAFVLVCEVNVFCETETVVTTAIRFINYEGDDDSDGLLVVVLVVMVLTTRSFTTSPTLNLPIIRPLRSSTDFVTLTAPSLTLSSPASLMRSRCDFQLLRKEQPAVHHPIARGRGECEMSAGDRPASYQSSTLSTT